MRPGLPIAAARAYQLRSIALAVGAAILLEPIPVHAAGNASLNLNKSIGGAILLPNLSVTLAVDKPTAVPGDSLTYTSTVTNTGSTVTLSGDFVAENNTATSAQIASYFDVFAISANDPCTPAITHGHNTAGWTPVAGGAGAQPGYSPVEPAPLASGMALSLTPVAAGGVTYPASGDPILGTQLQAGATATWHYVATMVLTPAQVTFLADPSHVTEMRNTFHAEVTPRVQSGNGQPDTVDNYFCQLLQPRASGNVTDVVVTLTPPEGAAPVAFTKTTTPGLALIAPGQSVTVTATHAVNVIAPKASGETDDAYFVRLGTAEGSKLKASVSASGSSAGGTVTAPVPPQAVTTEHVPIVTIVKTGPSAATAGMTVTYSLALNNIGGASAGPLTVTDTIGGSTSVPVTGVPQSLATGASATASAVYSIPAGTGSVTLDDVGAVTWQDFNKNSYGPVSSTFSTAVSVTPPEIQTATTTQVQGNFFAESAAQTTFVAKPGDTPAFSQTFPTLNFNPPTGGAGPLLGPFSSSGGVRCDGTFLPQSPPVAPHGTVTGTLINNTLSLSVTVTGAAVNTTFSVEVWPTSSGTCPSDNTANTGAKLTSDANGNATAAISIQLPYTPAIGWPTLALGQTQTYVLDLDDSLSTSASGDRFSTHPISIAAPGTIPDNASAVTPSTRPFTDLTTDLLGNFNGTIVAQGSGVQAGVGTLNTFDAYFTGNFVVTKPEDVTYNVIADDGFLLGVGNGAVRVSGTYENAPPSNTTPFRGYPLVGSFNQPGPGPRAYPVTVHYPAAGIYPYELDYFECCGSQLSLTVTVASVTANTSPLSIYTGYQDNLRPGGSTNFPFPWNGSPGVVFMGGGGNDDGALRFDNNTGSPIVLDKVTVDVGPFHYDIWPSSMTVPANQILILTSTAGDNFDTSDTPITCQQTGYIPQIHVTIGGVTTNYADNQQILNTGGVDRAVCSGNESTPWTRIAGSGQAINVPLPPAISLQLSPGKASVVVGQTQSFTASAMDGTGQPVANLAVALRVFGVNTGVVQGITNPAGNVTLSYVGVNGGTDTVSATASMQGLQTGSNESTVVWNIPIPGGAGSGGTAAQAPPSITALSPADGTVVTTRVPISANITPPSGQTITSWSVTYQAQDPEPPVTIASGTGPPPNPIAVFDPSLLANDTYVITVVATASGGGTQTVPITVAVYGNLKLGRYRTTFQDLTVPVNGIQMEVRRDYDSIDKRVGDFGAGWHVSVSDFRTSSNRQLGAGGWTQYNTSCAFLVCKTAYSTTVPHYVTVTWPDGHQEVFQFTPGNGESLFNTSSPAFRPMAGTNTTSTLSDPSGNLLWYIFDGNLYYFNIFAAPQVYNPTLFQLTTRDGRVLMLDVKLGLVSETDPNGNSLTYNSSGIHSTAGPSITFARDSQGRIITITGPSSQKLSYTYSAAGDLASSTDANGNVTNYSYDGNHDLLGATGPGATPIESEQYDANGRLSSITVGSGPPISVASNIGAQTVTFTDATGQLVTVNSYDNLGDLVREDRNFGSTTVTSAWTYDSVGHTLSSTDPLGRTLRGTYDSDGNLTSFTNAAGGVTSITYDSVGDPLTVTDPIGAVTTYTYDSTFNLVSRTDALGHTEAYGRDSNGRVTVYTDKLGQKTTFAYDAAGNVVSKTDPLGHTTTFTYDASNRLLSKTNALGGTTRYTYDAVGDLTSATDPIGRTVTLSYDSLLRLVSRKDAGGNTATYSYNATFPALLSVVTDPLGNTTSYAYDADGRLTQIADAMGGKRSFTYDPLGRITASTDALGRTTTSSYDAAGQLVSQVWPNGSHASFTFDALGDRTSVTDPLGHVTRTSFDADRRVASITNPLGRVLNITRDSIGQAVKITDPLGQASASVYDANGQLVASTDPAGATTRYTYDAAGNQTAVTDPIGRTNTATYDAAHRVIALTDPAGRTQSFTWDAADQLIAAARPSGATTHYQYSATGQQISVTDPLGAINKATYNADGDQASTTDPLGNVTSYTYDAKRRLTAITDALGGAVGFTYDAADQLTALKDPDGHSTMFTYDALGDPVSEVSPTSGSTSAQYDAAGRLISSSDGRGIVRAFVYDAGNELTSLTAPGISLSYSYDADGRWSSTTDSTGSTSYNYDTVSRITSIATPFGTTGYTYDAAGQRTSMTLAAGQTITYGHDTAGNLASLSDWLGHTFNYAYDSDNRLITATKPNGIVTSYTYDADNRPTSITHSLGGTTVAQFAYTYSAAGNRTSASTGSSTDHYSFDGLNRLTGVTYGSGNTAAYTYDAAGNRLSQTTNGVTAIYSYNSNGQLTSDGTRAYTYDASGNLASAGTSTYTYDSLDRLSGATVGGSSSSYRYDASGLRADSTGVSGTTHYQYDRARHLPLVVSDGISQYLHDGGLAEAVNGTTTAYPLTDALGSIRDVTNASGAVTATQSYDVFGGVTSTSGAVGAFGFTGAQTDSTGLLYLRARYLNPGTGQFNSPDYIQPNSAGTQGYNSYTYTANNPVSVTDPSGSCTSTPNDPGGEPTSPDAGNGGAGEGGRPASESAAREPQPSSPSDFVDEPRPVGDGVEVPRAPTDAADLPKPPGAYPRELPEPYAPAAEANFHPFGGAMMEYLSLLQISQEVFGSLMGLGQAVKKALSRVAFPELKRLGADPLLEPNADIQFMTGWSSNPPLAGGALFVDYGRLLPEDPAGECAAEGAPNSPPVNAAPRPADEVPGATAAAQEEFSGVRALSRQLREMGVPREERIQIIQSFDVSTIRRVTAGTSDYGLRFYGGGSRALSRYLSPTFPGGPARELLSLPSWNNMSRIAQYQIREGTTYYSGRVAPSFGQPGGGIQYFVPDLGDLNPA